MVKKNQIGVSSSIWYLVFNSVYIFVYLIFKTKWMKWQTFINRLSGNWEIVIYIAYLLGIHVPCRDHKTSLIKRI